jgi:hypothetical protein
MGPEVRDNIDGSSHLTVLLKLKLIYDRQAVGKSVLEPGTHLGTMTT